jgi:hypothetical protein
VLHTKNKIADKWWTSKPALYFDDKSMWPRFNACASRDGFGARGTMPVKRGDAVSSSFYVNVDHSGIYRFELACGTNAVNQDYYDNPITPWKVLHKSKELENGTPLADDRAIGYTMDDVLAYYHRTTCTAGTCAYSMNSGGGASGPDRAECTKNRADCFVEDTFTIPSNFQCSGKAATLRWSWLVADFDEIYVNCLDLELTDGSGGGVTPPTPAPTTAPPKDGDPGTCPSNACLRSPNCCSAGLTCFEKDQFFAQCMETCKPGVSPNDPPQYRTPWTCRVLGGGKSTTTKSPVTTVRPPITTTTFTNKPPVTTTTTLKPVTTTSTKPVTTTAPPACPGAGSVCNGNGREVAIANSCMRRCECKPGYFGTECDSTKAVPFSTIRINLSGSNELVTDCGVQKSYVGILYQMSIQTSGPSARPVLFSVNEGAKSMDIRVYVPGAGASTKAMDKVGDMTDMAFRHAAEDLLTFAASDRVPATLVSVTPEGEDGSAPPSLTETKETAVPAFGAVPFLVGVLCGTVGALAVVGVAMMFTARKTAFSGSRV